MMVNFSVKKADGVWEEFSVSVEECPAFSAKLQSDPNVVEWHAGTQEHLDYCPDCRAFVGAK